MKMAVTLKRKVEKSIRRWQIDHLAEGYKQAIDEIRGPTAKNGIWGQNQNFRAQKKGFISVWDHVLATTGQSYAKKKVTFSQINNF